MDQEDLPTPNQQQEDAMAFNEIYGGGVENFDTYPQLPSENKKDVETS
jgi:hypothetical protein